MASGLEPWSARESRRRRRDAAGTGPTSPSRRMTALPDFSPSPAADGDIGAGLIDHPDDAHGDAGPGGIWRPLARVSRGRSHRPGRGGRRYRAGRGDGGDPPGVRGEAVEEARHPLPRPRWRSVALAATIRSVAASSASARGAQRGSSFSARHQREFCARRPGPAGQIGDGRGRPGRCSSCGQGYDESTLPGSCSACGTPSELWSPSSSTRLLRPGPYGGARKRHTGE